MGKAIPYWENHMYIENELYKKCLICKDWFSCNEENFYKNNKSKSDGLYPYCIECTKRKSYKWILENPEKHSEHMKKETSKPHIKENLTKSAKLRRESGKYKEWQQSENGKKSTKESNKKYKTKLFKIPTKQLNVLYAYCESKCMYCGLSDIQNMEKYNRRLSKDHAINKGQNDISNCVLCCTSCSSSKHDSDWLEWYTPNNEHFSESRYNLINEWLLNWKKYINKTQ